MVGCTTEQGTSGSAANLNRYMHFYPDVIRPPEFAVQTGCR